MQKQRQQQSDGIDEFSTESAGTLNDSFHFNSNSDSNKKRNDTKSKTVVGIPIGLGKTPNNL